MYYSIYNKLINLDENLIVYPGHHYGSTKTSTLRDEKKSNFVFKFHNREEFLRYMNTLKVKTYGPINSAYNFCTLKQFYMSKKIKILDKY